MSSKLLVDTSKRFFRFSVIHHDLSLPLQSVIIKGIHCIITPCQIFSVDSDVFRRLLDEVRQILGNPGCRSNMDEIG